LIRAFNPKTGEEFHVAGNTLTDIQAIRDKGYVLASDQALEARTAEQEASDEQAREEAAKKTPLAKLGAAGAVIAGIGEPIRPLVSAIANKVRGSTPEDVAFQDAARENVEKEHPYAYWGARVPAEVAGALATGEVAGLASGAIKGAGVLRAGARALAEGAIFAAPDATAKALNGDPQGAAESLALSVGVAAGLHGIFSLGSRIVGRVAQASAEADARALSEEGLAAGRKVIADAVSPAFADRIGEESRPLLEKLGLDPEKATAEDIVKAANDARANSPAVKAAYDGLEKVDRGELRQVLGDAAEDLSKLPEHPDVERIWNKLASVTDWKGARELRSWLDDFKPTAQPAKPLAGVADIPAVAADHLDALRAVDDAKDAIHLRIVNAQKELLSRMGPDLSTKVVDGLHKENAVTALRTLFGGIENVPAPERKGIIGAITKLRQRSPAMLAAGFIAHAAGLGHVGAPAVVAFNAAKDAIASSSGKRVFARAMRNALGTARPNATLAIDAVRSMDERIATGVDGLMGDLSSGKTFKHAIEPSLSRFLPNGGSGLSRAAQITVLRRAVAQHQDNPEAVAEHLASLTAPLHDEGLAPVGMAYAQHQVALMKVIQSVLPPDPQPVHPFAEPPIESIAPAVFARVDRTLALASDPLTLFSLVRSNTITPTDVAIVQYTNPATLQKMRVKAVEQGIKKGGAYSYQQRISLGYLMGTDLDADSKATVPVLQAAFGPALANTPTGPRAGLQNNGENADGQDAALESHLTVSQKSLTSGS
jgi:hypothetical protein